MVHYVLWRLATLPELADLPTVMAVTTYPRTLIRGFGSCIILLVGPLLPESGYPTLYGVFSRKAQPSLQELMEGEDQQREGFVPVHCLLLDRETRRWLYTCQRAQALLLFSLAELDEKDRPTVFIDGLRMSAGNENYRVLRPRICGVFCWFGRKARNCSALEPGLSRSESPLCYVFSSRIIFSNSGSSRRSQLRQIPINVVNPCGRSPAYWRLALPWISALYCPNVHI